MELCLARGESAAILSSGVACSLSVEGALLLVWEGSGSVVVGVEDG